MYKKLDKRHNIVYTKYIRRELIKMTTTIQKWGNSQGIRIPKFLLDEVNWNGNEQLIVSADKDRLIIEKAKPKRKTISELFADFDGEYVPVEMDWGEPEGTEIW